LHVAAWHFYEPDAERDGYLAKLIEACHREGILVYAWFELPHVSEKFWDDHPEWREKTAVLQDAQLDWRKLMNLTNRDCFRAVSAGVKQSISRFDWDGVNLAELYFESLEGTGNTSRFTPMNDDVRTLFQKQSGFDPIEIFGARKDEASRRAFLDFRSELVRRMQEEWIAELEAAVETKSRQSYTAGVRAGEEAARRSLESGVHEAVQRLAATAAELVETRAETIRRAEADTVRLSIEIARRVLHREISVDGSALEALIKAAMEKLQAQEVYRVRIHPDQEKLVRACLDQTGRGQSIVVVSDPAQPEGGAVFEISRGSLDASVGTQLAEIERGLIDQLEAHV